MLYMVMNKVGQLLVCYGKSQRAAAVYAVPGVWFAVMTVHAVCVETLLVL